MIVLSLWSHGSKVARSREQGCETPDEGKVLIVAISTILVTETNCTTPFLFVEGGTLVASLTVDLTY